MDPDMIAGSALLSVYGNFATDAVKDLWGTIEAKLKPRIPGILEDFNPDDKISRDAIQQELAKAMKKDAAFANEIEKLVQALPANMTISQAIVGNNTINGGITNSFNRTTTQ
ncbi:MAG: hypothetical protein HQL07_08660 [Nitrospirae bacterium]|nr:hypothetical protein [Magnetococcales bacterium]